MTAAKGTPGVPEQPAGGPPLVWDMPGQGPQPDPAVDAAEPHPSPPVPSPAPGHVILATVEPVTEVHVPALDEGGASVVITRDGTEVDEATAERAYAAAMESGYRLRDITPG